MLVAKAWNKEFDHQIDDREILEIGYSNLLFNVCKVDNRIIKRLGLSTNIWNKVCKFKVYSVLPTFLRCRIINMVVDTYIHLLATMYSMCQKQCECLSDSYGNKLEK